VVHAPYRTAAPPEPEQPDSFDAYEAVLRARSGSTPRLVVMMCGAITVLWAGVSLAHRSPRAAASESAEAEAARRIAKAHYVIEEARRTALAEQSWFEDTLRVALGHDVGPSATPCETTLPEANGLFQGRPAFPMLIVARGESSIPSPSVAAVLADVERAEEHLAKGRTLDGILYAKGLSGSRPRLERDVVLVTSVMKHPTRRDIQSYEPGEVAGRAYLYDFGERRVTCVGDIRASSSRQVAYSFASGEATPAGEAQGPSLSASLDADLLRQLEKAISHGGLFAITP
jgi:hypothetical protein